MAIDRDTEEQIKALSRAEIVGLLEGQGGYQCYDHEDTEDLRDTLRTDIESGACEYDLSGSAPVNAHPFMR